MEIDKLKNNVQLSDLEKEDLLKKDQIRKRVKNIITK